MSEIQKIRVVAAVVVRADGKILCARRGNAKNPCVAWKWEFPGGKIEAGECPQDALKREILEELDAEIEVGELLETVEWDYPDFHLTMHCFICKLLSESMHLNEHEAATWLGRDTLDSVKWLPADEGLIQNIKKIL